MKTKNLKIWQVALFLFATTLLVTSCDNDDEPKKKGTEAKTIQEEDIADWSKWFYFSFDSGKFVGTGASDPAKGDDDKWSKRTDWDIAFHMYDVRTNSGTSGGAKGGIVKMKTTDFNAVTEVPTDSTFTEDTFAKVMNKFVMPPTPMTLKKASVSPVATNWVGYSHKQGAWLMNMRNVFVVKTADGKYVKIKFINFLDDKDTFGYLTFKYAFLEK